MFRYTKIGATIGPACEDQNIIEEMIKTGMNFARLNFSHGTYEWHEKIIKRIRAAAEKLNEPIAILQDLQGPRIRIGDLPVEGVKVSAGEKLVLDTSAPKYSGSSIPIDQPDLHRYLNHGDRFLIDDGRIELKVEKVSGSEIHAIVNEGGIIKSHKGINVPDSKLLIPALSEKDRDDLKFGVLNGVDMVGLSFVSSAQDVFDVRNFIDKILSEAKITLPHPIMIIAKIERHEAIENLKEIIAAAGGIMVARGDLGLELPLERVPIVQKNIIDLSRKSAKPVIVATQLLDSMRENKRPTRAEVSDVANAVIDHTDGLLLTNETAAGLRPVEAVRTMSEIVLTTEKSVYDDLPLPALKDEIGIEQAVCKYARLLAEEVNADFILAASISGETGRLLSHVRPANPSYIATNEQIVYRQLSVSWGVKPFILPFCKSIEEFVERSMTYLKENKITKVGDRMIVVAGEPMGLKGNVNLVEVRKIS
jgi:pyruvate kinase